MTKWEYLEVNVRYDDDGIESVYSNWNVVFIVEFLKKKNKGRSLLERTTFNLPKYINLLGKDGWELVNVAITGRGNRNYYFKRIIQE